MNIKRQMTAFALALLQIIALAACAEVPDSIDRDGVVVADTNNAQESKTDDPALSIDSIPVSASKTPTEESLAIISDSDGQHIEMNLEISAGNKLCIDAVVETDGITQVSKYNYVLVPVSDELRQNLFAARFGDRVSEIEYDELNNVWTLSNSSSSIADYYLYNTYYPMAGETVPGEESFSLEYRKVNLYPFDDNLLESVSNSTVALPLDEVISLCNQLVDAVANLEEYTVDYVHAYGTNGRRPYYKLVYKRVLDGIPVTGYNDLIFLVDSDGVEKVYGSIFDVEEVGLQEPIISAEAAVAVLSSNIAQVSFGENEMLSIGKITLEYLVTKNMMGETSIIPVWRFWLGGSEDQMNLNRGKILAVDAVTGELIQGERGHTF